MLYKLAEFLKEGKHEERGIKFDFSDYGNGKPSHQCGTVACAAGLLPLLFPNTFDWNTEGEPDALTSDLYRIPLCLTYDEVAHLFFPGQQNPDCASSDMFMKLSSNATADEVANNIFEFLNVTGRMNLIRDENNQIIKPTEKL